MSTSRQYTVEKVTGSFCIDKEGLMKYIDIVRLKHPAFVGQYRHLHGLVQGSEPARFTIDDEIGMLRIMGEVERLLSETDISQASAISSE